MSRRSRGKNFGSNFSDKTWGLNHGEDELPECQSEQKMLDLTRAAQEAQKAQEKAEAAAAAPLPPPQAAAPVALPQPPAAPAEAAPAGNNPA